VASEVATDMVACLADGDMAAGMEQINGAIGDGVDPRQLGREIVETLRGVLLVQEGAGIRLLSASAEQAAVIESLAARMPVRRVVRAIQLFNEATTSLKRGGIDSIPQLPLEMALVQSMWEEGSPPDSYHHAPEHATAPRPSRGEGVPQVSLRSAQEQAPRLREGGGDVPSAASLRSAQGEASSPQEGPEEGAPAVGATPRGRPLALEDVRLAWKQILQAMRQRNPATQAVLASGCKPVEVHGDQVTVTVPSTILAEKLRDAQRMAEIEQVAGEVLDTRCRVKLVVAADYVAPADTPSVPVSRGDTPSSPEEEPRAEGGVPDPLARWAQKRGGKARLVE
jgi:DNA polymerase III gamma/tau subunit